jgi:hypothetical protein
MQQTRGITLPIPRSDVAHPSLPDVEKQSGTTLLLENIKQMKYFTLLQFVKLLLIVTKSLE